MDPVPACYVLAPLGMGYRWVLASLWAGCLPLAMESGCLHSPKIPLTDRICSLCDCNEVEDKYHFLHKERSMLFVTLLRLT